MSTYKQVKQTGLATTWDACDIDLVSAEGMEATLKKYGTFTALRAIMPIRGDILAGWPNYMVTKATLSRKTGQMGELVIYLVGTESTITPLPKPNFRKVHVKWREINVPLYDGYYQTFGSNVDVCLLKVWEAEPDPTLKAAFKCNAPILYGSQGMYVVKYEEKTLTNDTLDVAKRLLSGETSHKIVMPVVSIVERFSSEPTNVKGPMVTDGPSIAKRFPRIGGTKSGSNAAYIPGKDVIATVTKPKNDRSYQYICFGTDIEDSDRGWVRTWEWQGGLAPTGLLGSIWGGNPAYAFDPKFYPAASATIPA